MICTLCPNRCGVDRRVQTGACGCPEDGCLVVRAALHPYEEPPLSGTRGSGAIFFSGCTMRCTYCQNVAISRKPTGVFLTPYQLSELFRRLEDAGAHNVNLVSPTPYLPVLEAAFALYRPSIPVIYNTSGYETEESVLRAAAFTDIWLPDFKYVSRDLSLRLSGRPDYPEAAAAALARMRACARDAFCGPLMTGGMIVRHLVLPGLVRESRQTLLALANLVGTSTLLSLMAQYTPMPGMRGTLARAITPLEYKAVFSAACRAGFSSIFTQRLDASSPSFIPDWRDRGLL